MIDKKEKKESSNVLKKTFNMCNFFLFFLNYELIALCFTTWIWEIIFLVSIIDFPLQSVAPITLPPLI